MKLRFFWTLAQVGGAVEVAAEGLGDGLDRIAVVELTIDAQEQGLVPGAIWRGAQLA
jgi:hypothetical protein